MSKYVCQICGYEYDEDVEKTKFSDLPDDFVCPECGAPKDLFELKEDNEKKEKNDGVRVDKDKELVNKDELKELSDDELEIIFTSLSKASEKQYNLNDSKIFSELADVFKKKHHNKEKDSIELIDNALNSSFKKAFSIATSFLRFPLPSLYLFFLSLFS